jgi:hypothetical protein
MNIDVTDSNDDSRSDTCSSGCPLHRVRRPLYIAIVWLGAAVGALYVADIPHDFGESLCGAWGCLPPVQALAAMHLFWCVLFGAETWAIYQWRSSLLRPLGAALLLAGVGGIWLIVANDQISSAEPNPMGIHYWCLKRAAFVLATATNFPVVQAVFAGIVSLWLGSKCAQRSNPTRLADSC